MTVIERWQVHIHCIHVMNKLRSQATNVHKVTTINLEEHHFIGKLQNFPVNIATLLCENQGDPAIKVRTIGG